MARVSLRRCWTYSVRGLFYPPERSMIGEDLSDELNYPAVEQLSNEDHLAGVVSGLVT